MNKMPVAEEIWRLNIGASAIGSKGVAFRVWAPGKERLSVKIISGAAESMVPLQKDGQGYFTGVAGDARPGDLYLYDLGNNRQLPDPASRFQPAGVHAYSEVIDPDAFLWEDSEWRCMALRDFIIYELHVGTFTPEGTFDAVVSRLDYLAGLGITAIELLPVAQFPGNRNWGYDGVYPFAPQNTYGGPQGMKKLVNECHKRGLAVILDVVYNHLGPEGNCLAEFGPYFTDRYKTLWGQAVNFDGPYSDEVRRFFISNALYWVVEYHVDALRLDAVHGIFDFSARHFLEELSEALRMQSVKSARPFYLIAESDLNNARIIEPGRKGGYGIDAQWNDDFHHALHALVTGERTGYYEDFGDIGHLEKAFREGFVYTGQYSRYRRRRHGNSSKDRPAEQFIVFSQSHDQVGNRAAGDRLSAVLPLEKLKLIAGVVLLSPFIPLLFMGEEYGETAPFLYFISHSDPALAKAVSEGRRKEFSFESGKDGLPDPLDEKSFICSKLDIDMSVRGQHAMLHAFYRRLIQLRTELPALRNTTKEDMETCSFASEKALFLRQRCVSGEAFSLYNFGQAGLKKELLLPQGLWDGEIDSSSVQWGGEGGRQMRTIDSDGSGTELLVKPYSFVLYKKIGLK